MSHRICAFLKNDDFGRKLVFVIMINNSNRILSNIIYHLKLLFKSILSNDRLSQIV